MPALETCENCGTAFARSRSSNRFCSRRCQRFALARQDRAARALWRAASRIILLAYTNGSLEIDFEAHTAPLGNRALSDRLGGLSARQSQPQEPQAGFNGMGSR